MLSDTLYIRGDFPERDNDFVTAEFIAHEKAVEYETKIITAVNEFNEQNGFKATKDTKEVEVTVECRATYKTTISVPNDCDKATALNIARNNLPSFTARGLHLDKNLDVIAVNM